MNSELELLVYYVKVNSANFANKLLNTLLKIIKGAEI